MNVSLWLAVRVVKQPLLELATLLQADKRWDDSRAPIERGIELADLHQKHTPDLYHTVSCHILKQLNFICCR